MKHVHLDTSHLVNGFESLLSVNSDRDRLSSIDAIDLLCHLVCRNKIYYDGEVFGKQKDRLEKVIEQVTQAVGDRRIESKLQPLHTSGDSDAPLVHAAVTRAVSNAGRLRAEIRDLANDLDHCTALPNADDFEQSITKVLIPQLKKAGSIEGVDAIWSDKSVAGRRFIWAALKDEETRNILRGAVSGLQKPARLLQLVFAHFRAEYAIERNKIIALRDSIGEDDLFYAPSSQRSSILKTAFKTLEGKNDAEQTVNEKIVSSWFRVTDPGNQGGHYLPLQLQLVLSKMNGGSYPKTDILRQTLELSNSSEGRDLSRAIGSLTHSYIGCANPDNFLSNLRDDLCLERQSAQKFLIFGSTTEFALWGALVTAKIAGATAAVAGAASTAVMTASALPLLGAIPYIQWRFRNTRVNARRLAQILPLDLSSNDYVNRFHAVFGADPPAR
jgi:hypothetical protein